MVLHLRPVQPLPGAKHPMGVQRRVGCLLQYLWEPKVSDTIGILSLVGMGGVGKTTLARALHSELRLRFSRRHAIIEVGLAEGGGALDAKQRELLEQLTAGCRAALALPRTNSWTTACGRGACQCCWCWTTSGTRRSSCDCCGSPCCPAAAAWCWPLAGGTSSTGAKTPS